VVHDGDHHVRRPPMKVKNIAELKVETSA